MLMRAASRVVVPLNAMCSTTWLMPASRVPSWPEPVRTKTLALALASHGMWIVTTRTPLGKVVRRVSRLSWRLIRVLSATRAGAAAAGPCLPELDSRPYDRPRRLSTTGAVHASLVHEIRPRRHAAGRERRRARPRQGRLRHQLEGAGRAW